jgi:hypothetical protein
MVNNMQRPKLGTYVLCGTTGFFIKQEMRREGREKLTEKDL